MKRYWDNLRPLEKRLLVFVGLVVFVVLNIWKVVPHFGDWGKVQMRMAKAQDTLVKFQREIQQMPKTLAEIAKLQSEGQEVPAEDQFHHFSSTLQSVAIQSGVIIGSTSKPQIQTNQFFLEQSQQIRVQATEKPLVEFLYNLGAGNSLIRVRDLALSTDAPHQQLVATIKLVASYQKNPPKGSSKSTPATAGVAAKPAPVQSATQPATPSATQPPAQPPTQPRSSQGIPRVATQAPNQAPPVVMPASTTSSPAAPQGPMNPARLPQRKSNANSNPGSPASTTSPNKTPSTTPTSD